jgi:hypothetical protein
MSTKKIVVTTSILIVMTIALFIFPSSNPSLNAEQSTYKAYPISSSSVDVISKYFSKDVIENTLKQPGCVGIRMYYERRNDGSATFMLAGIDKNGNELIASIMPNKCPQCDKNELIASIMPNKCPQCDKNKLIASIMPNKCPQCDKGV